MKSTNWKAILGCFLQGLVIVGICLIIISLPVEAKANDGKVLTVMTQNVYLGSSLDPALAASSQEEFLEAVAFIYGTVLFTNFPERAGAITDTIDRYRPDIIGLQEVSKWTSVGPGAPPTLDFLEILQLNLAARGLNYVVAAVSDNAEIGPVPQLFMCDAIFACFVTLNDRDVILVNADNPHLQINDSASGLYVAQLQVPTAVGPISFDRGWAYIDATYRGKEFRFVNTHLELAAAAPYQEAQGQEFLFGPANTGGTVIAVGDFNSAADGSTTSTYGDLTSGFFRDAWPRWRRYPGYTCCQSSALVNPVSELSSRIDLILTMGRARGFLTQRVGHRTFQDIPPYWASDHAGVITRVWFY
jgi:endonuclease/exonuclease/phosphatase family metal-dependent hydrolase